MTTTTVLIGLNKFFFSSFLGLGVAITLDATGLRRSVGELAGHLNSIESKGTDVIKHRKSMGYTKFELIGGLLLGILLAFIINSLIF